MKIRPLFARIKGVIKWIVQILLREKCGIVYLITLQASNYLGLVGDFFNFS
jgi:hypothetical protein